MRLSRVRFAEVKQNCFIRMTGTIVYSAPCVTAVRLILEKSRPQSIFGIAVLRRICNGAYCSGI